MNQQGPYDLWLFMTQYWDDHITLPGEQKPYINARTVRVLRAIYGPIFDELSKRWTKDGDMRFLGDPDHLDANAPCIELLAYVTRHDTA